MVLLDANHYSRHWLPNFFTCRNDDGWYVCLSTLDDPSQKWRNNPSPIRGGRTMPMDIGEGWNVCAFVMRPDRKWASFGISITRKANQGGKSPEQLIRAVYMLGDACMEQEPHRLLDVSQRWPRAQEDSLTDGPEGGPRRGEKCTYKWCGWKEYGGLVLLFFVWLEIY